MASPSLSEKQQQQPPDTPTKDSSAVTSTRASLLSGLRSPSSSSSALTGSAASIHNSSNSNSNSRPGSPSTVLTTPSRQRVASPSIARTPQRPGSAGGSGSGNPEAALTSLQELIRTMPAPTESPSQTSARSSPAMGQPRSLRSAAGTGSNGSSSASTLNPNAGGFQPGALSSLGEVEHEVLNTPLASTFGSPQRQQPHPQTMQTQPQAPSVGNVFGSPLQTPQSQIGQAHFAQQAQEWQNFHNVFNAGIGNSNNNSAGGGGVQSPGSFAAAAGLDLSGMDPSLVSAAIAMNPMQAQLAMLQALQQQQQQLAGSNAQFSSPQQNLLLQQQQQQLQIQALMNAQLQLHQQSQAGTNLTGSPSSIARFGGGGGASLGQSGSQPDLAALAASGNHQQQQQFVAEQNALTAQYEALRQQQQELMLRFSEMQFQAAQLAQAQQQQQQQTQAQTQLPGQPTTGRNSSTAGAGSHRRGPSASVSSSAAAAASALGSGPMGQFGSMGNFALPSSASANSISGLGQGQPSSGLPKGHGRRHSVNISGNKRAENMNAAFSFPAGSGNPTQQQQQGMEAQFQNLGLGGVPQPSQEDLEHAPPPASRIYGHGRRESRGSIGSLAGWGSNSNIVTQSSVPIGQTNITDLAQAQAQLTQLTQFRASAGHARVPSFGVSQLSTPGGPGGNQQQRKSLFAPYLPAASIPPLLQTGKLVIGTLRVNKRNRSDAYVATDVLEADVFICGSKDRNRALEGDVVAVELLDVDEVWGAKREKEEKKRKKEESAALDPRFAQMLRKNDKKKDDVEVEGQGLTLFEDEEVNDDQRPTYAGHVVAVVERQAGQLFAGTLGILRPSSAATKEKQDAERRERDGIDVRGTPGGGNDSSAHNSSNNNPGFRPKIVWFKPIDKRVPLVAIPADQAPGNFLDSPETYNSTLFVACIKRWPITSLHPFGALVEELGEIGNIEAETNALMKDCGFTDETFSENVAKCLPPVPWTIPQTEIDARKDFRQCRVFTIDPETARDLDDALHINALDDGTFEVGVHIADVSHFVKPNTALDREARRRGTTVYLVQRASPMLPEQLSSTLCSLQPGEDRLTFSAVFKMSADGQVLSTWYGKSVIRSAAKLAYSFAQTAIDSGKLPEHVKIHDEHDPAGIVTDIKQLDDMARQMRARRFENGSLRIDNVKLSFSLDGDGRPSDCKVYERLDSHSLIEEFMLLANAAVAQKIAAGLPDQALLRRHEAPIERRIEGFSKRASRLGYDFDISSAGSLMDSFGKLQKEDPELVLRMLATKAMLRAKYICSGMFDIAAYHHYALNIPVYTHFTSPIRRYADVIVHRQLEAALSETPETRFLMDSEAVSKVAQHCNQKKAAAKLAQEQSQHLFLCTLIADLTQRYGPVKRQAHVIAVLDQSFDVVVQDFGIEKRVHVDQMPIENHVHDERANTLQLYWKKGVDVLRYLADNSGDPHVQRIKQTAERHATLMGASSRPSNAESALFEEDEDEEGQVKEVKGDEKGSVQRQKSTQKMEINFQDVEETPAGHCIQTVKELHSVPVIVSADLTVCPPVIKVFAINPFA